MLKMRPKICCFVFVPITKVSQGTWHFELLTGNSLSSFGYTMRHKKARIQKKKQKKPPTSPCPDTTRHLLSISQVDGAEQRVFLRCRFAMLVLVQEDWGTTHLHPELLDALLVVDRQQKGLETSLGFDGKHDWEIFWENSPWRSNKQQANTRCWWKPVDV